MAVMTVFEEDQLIPIATMGPCLTLFSSLDGGVYRVVSSFDGDPAVYESLVLADLVTPFCLPGTAIIYDLVHSKSALSVTEHCLSIRGISKGAERSLPCPPMEGYRLAALVSNGAGTPCAVFSPKVLNGASFLLDTDTGQIIAESPAGETPMCVFSDGATVTMSFQERWTLRDASGARLFSGTGTIISPNSDSAIIKRSTKTGPVFSILRSSGVTEVASPPGWTLWSVASSDSLLVAYGIHGVLGQRILEADISTMTFEISPDNPGTCQVFPMGSVAPPIVRTSSLVSGSQWRFPTTSIGGICPARNDILLNYVQLEELPCVVVRRDRVSTRLLLVLHGGPDSHELDDLRYDAAYRDLIDAGLDILIVNYPGSTGFGKPFQRMAWGAWIESAAQVANMTGRFASECGYQTVTVFGVSFGAWMALRVTEIMQQTAEHFSDSSRSHPAIDCAIALSPILNLYQHLRLHSSEDPEFKKWAEDRFLDVLSRAGAEAMSVASQPAPVVVIAPDGDEVVSPNATLAFIRKSGEAGALVEVLQVPGRHYPRDSKESNIRWTLLRNAIISAGRMP